VAHKVTIFAWVEGDTVYTQSKFSGGKRAKNSTVVVYDKEGNQLLEGKTDEKGEFAFKVPKQTDLKIVLKASMGHLAEWTIPAEEITAGIDKAKGSTPEGGVEAATQEAAPLTEAKTSIPTAVTLNRKEVQTLIDESLDRKLAPIVRMLGDQVGRGPTVSEVLGGIGYIFGLAGVAFYFSSRRKKGSDVR
jgi:nickel transport protein